MSDLDNVFWLRRVGIRKQRKTVGIAADGGYTCPLHSLRGTRFGKAAPPASIGRLAPYNPGQVCHRSRKAFYVARPRAYVASLSLTHCYGNAGHKRSFSAHSHCGGRCLARFSFVGTAVAFTKCSFAAAAQGSPPLRPVARA